jgi:hypothetical protein
MFGKKQSEEVPQIPMLVLTTETLIEGMMRPTKGLNFYLYVSNVEQGGGRSTEIQGATIQFLSGGEVPPRSVASFMAHGDHIIALIPRSGQTISTSEKWMQYRLPVPGAYHFGPYLFTGTMMRLSDSQMDIVMPMVDVRISSLLPTNRLAEFSVPFCLVNTRWMSGYETA